MITETRGFDCRLSERIIAVNFGIRIAVSEIINEAGQYSPQFGEQRLILTRIAREALLQEGEIIVRHDLEEMFQISTMSEALILDQYCDGKTTHVGIQLPSQTRDGISVTVIDNSQRVILNVEATCQDAVPQFRISAAACGAD